MIDVTGMIFFLKPNLVSRCRGILVQIELEILKKFALPSLEGAVSHLSQHPIKKSICEVINPLRSALQSDDTEEQKGFCFLSLGS